MIVTDKKYYMQQYLMENLLEIPFFLRDLWDCVIICSGHGKVRIGKSSLAIQMAYFIAWLLAGGQMAYEEIKREDGKTVKRWFEKSPNKNPVAFDNSHVVFSPDELRKKAEQLPRNSVIVYDEGRAGLESDRAMENINKGMMDFFQECGQYGHVVLIVLPNFFRLHEDYAVARSLFLVDVFAIARSKKKSASKNAKGYERGYFNFYNESRKEWLYSLGKKKIGITNKYMATNSNFWGRFTKAFPIDRELYEKQKREALRKKKKTRLEKKFRKQRDFAFFLLKKFTKMTGKEIAEVFFEETGEEMNERYVNNCIEEAERAKNTRF